MKMRSDGMKCSVDFLMRQSSRKLCLLVILETDFLQVVSRIYCTKDSALT